MAIFEEKQPKVFLIILVIVCGFLLAYMPFGPLMSKEELIGSEGTQAVLVQETHGFSFLLTAHGQLAEHVYPLFPAFAKAIHACGVSVEYSLRIVSVASLAVLTLLTGLIAGRMLGRQAGAAAAVITFTTLLTGIRTTEGYPQLLTALVIYSGWMLWLYWGMRASWNAAWIFTGLFAILAFFSGGLTAFFLFLVPLAFQQRPFQVWTRLKLKRYPGFLIAMTVCIIAFSVWLTVKQNFIASNPGKAAVPADVDILAVIKHFFEFPFQAICKLFPWSLLLWAPFCPALYPLEEKPLFLKYHRVLFIVAALLLWLNPESKQRDLLYLIPLIAVLIASKYNVMVRRYSRQIFWIVRVLIISGVLICLIIAFFCIFFYKPFVQYIAGTFTTMGLSEAVPITGQPLCIMMLAGIAGIFILLGVAIRLKRSKKPIWLVWLTVFTAFMQLNWFIVSPVKAEYCINKKILGHQIAAAMGKDGVTPENGPVIYKDIAINGLYAEGYYSGFRFRALPQEQIPETPETVYILTSGIPSHYARSWTRLFGQKYRGESLYLYKGTMLNKELSEGESIYDD